MPTAEKIQMRGRSKTGESLDLALGLALASDSRLSPRRARVPHSQVATERRLRRKLTVASTVSALHTKQECESRSGAIRCKVLRLGATRRVARHREKIGNMSLLANSRVLFLARQADFFDTGTARPKAGS